MARVKFRSKVMKVSPRLELLLYEVNIERIKKGKNALTRTKFTKKIADRYLNDRGMLYDDFIKL